MTTIYKTTSPELAKQVLSLPTFNAVLSWYRQALEIASQKNNETIADFARELSHLWCEQNNGATIQIVAK